MYFSVCISTKVDDNYCKKVKSSPSKIIIILAGDDFRLVMSRASHENHVKIQAINIRVRPGLLKSIAIVPFVSIFCILRDNN